MDLLLFIKLHRSNNKSPELYKPRAFSCVLTQRTPLVCGVDRHFLAVTPHTLEFDDAVDQGEQSIILAAADIVARVDVGAVLTVDDVTGTHSFTAEFFTAESLTVRITAVSGAPDPFLVCHLS